MSQATLTVGSGPGAAVRAGFNAALQRLATKGSGTSRPSDIVAGEHWIETDNPGGGLWALWLYDGTSDILDAVIDTNNHLMHRVIGQVVTLATGAVATGTTQIPIDDSIPQNTEGDQYMSLAITPLRSTSRLVIEAVGFFAFSVADKMIAAALFQDSTAAALKSGANMASTADGPVPVLVRHIMTAGTTSSTTFKVRAGVGFPGTLTFNGSAGGRLHGGVLSSGITIREDLL
jgi:hypothetical protein